MQRDSVSRAPRLLSPSEIQARRPTRANRSSRSPSRSINSRCCIPPPSFGSRAGVQGPELMMMSAMMAAGLMRRTLGEGPQHGPRGTVPSAAAAQRRQQTSPRRVAGSKISFFVRLNQSDAILAARFSPQECAKIQLRVRSFVSTQFLAFLGCAERQVLPRVL